MAAVAGIVAVGAAAHAQAAPEAAPASGARPVAAVAGAPLTELWRLQREQKTPGAGGEPVLAGPVAYAPGAGELPSLFAMVMGLRLTVSDAAGREMWSAEVEGTAHQTLAVADIDRDGRNELLAALDDGIMCVRDGGTVAWRRPIDNIVGPVACANVLGDERLEVLAADGDGGLTCLDSDGRVMWHLLAESARRRADRDQFISRRNWDFVRYLNRDATTPPAVGDVDGDGQAEIIFATETGFVYCVSGRGEWKWQFRARRMCLGSPVIADLDRDGNAEVLVGSDDRHLYILDGATGRMRAAAPAKWSVGPNIAVADLDGDGKLEAVFGDDTGILYCCDANGRERWRLPFKAESTVANYGDRCAAPPAIADIDGDGKLELVLGLRGRELLYVVSADGKVEGSYPLESGIPQSLAESGVWDTPIVADLNRDGRLEVLVATKLFTVCCFRAAAKAEANIVWAGARGNGALTGCTLARCGGATKAELRRQRAGQTGVIALSSDAASLVEGAVNADVRRPADVEAVLLSSITTTGGARELRIDQVLAARDQFGVAAPFDRDWPATLRCTEVNAADGRALAEASADIRMSAADARARVHDETLSSAEATIQALHLDWPNKTALAAARAAGVDGWTSEPPSAATWAQRDVKVGVELRALPHLVERQRGKDGGGSYLLTWTANPWDVFDPGITWPETEEAVPAKLDVALYRGEYEAGAVNLLNLSAQPLGVRAAVSDLVAADGSKLLAAQHIALRQTAMVPRHAGDRAGDVLPRLDEAGLITIAPMQAAQLWVTVFSANAKAGEYVGKLTLTELTPQGKQAVAPLRVKIWPIAMPEKAPVHLCTWAYLDSSLFANQIDAAMADLLAHRNDVFTYAGSFDAPYDAAGQLGAPEWSALDLRLDRYKGHGIILLSEPTLKFSGQGKAPNDAWEKAYAESMRALARHLIEQGLKYEDWAIYVTDEPGLERGPRIAYLIEHGRRIKQADPRIQTYTDPVAPMGLEDLKRAAPYVDLWCPEQDSLYRVWGPTPDMRSEERLAIMKADSAQVWTYECFPGVKRKSPLGYYRHQAWLAWKLGLNGMGFWTYCTDPNDPWLPNKDEYMLVYPGEDGPIPSKRWEACRDGVEDYTALWLARQAVDAAVARGEPGAAAARAELDSIVNQVLEERAVWPSLQQARQRLADITMAFRSGG